VIAVAVREPGRNRSGAARVQPSVLIFLGIVLLVVQVVVVIRYGTSKPEDESKRRKALIVTSALVLLASIALFLTA